MRYGIRSLLICVFLSQIVIFFAETIPETKKNFQGYSSGQNAVTSESRLFYHAGRPLIIPPDDVSIHNINGNMILSWTEVPNAVSYIVEGSDSTNSGFSNISYRGSFTMQDSTMSWSQSATQPHQFYRVKSLLSEFVLVPGGTFTMGATYSTEGYLPAPLHQVTLSPFYISNFEVTQAEWLSVMGTNPSYFTGNLNLPVNNIIWCKCIVYCNKRSIADSLTPCYFLPGYGTNPDNWPEGNCPDTISCNWAANGYRLPTEAEWEYAARGASNTPDYYYAGSDSINAVSWYSINSSGIVHPVGEKKPNAIGLFDMSGNMAEWCWDNWGDYNLEPQINPTGPPVLIDHRKALRGGSWRWIEFDSRIARRGPYYSNWLNTVIGLRVVVNSPH